jgi:hypothetical protein
MIAVVKYDLRQLKDGSLGKVNFFLINMLTDHIGYNLRILVQIRKLSATAANKAFFEPAYKKNIFLRHAVQAT